MIKWEEKRVSVLDMQLKLLVLQVLARLWSPFPTLSPEKKKGALNRNNELKAKRAETNGIDRGLMSPAY